MTVVTHDVNLFSLGPTRISKSRLKWSEKLVYSLFSYQKKSIGTAAFMWGENIFAFIAVQRDIGHFLAACRALDLFEPLYFLLLSICKDCCSIIFIFAVFLSYVFFNCIFQIQYCKISFLKFTEYVLLDYKNTVALFNNIFFIFPYSWNLVLPKLSEKIISKSRIKASNQFLKHCHDFFPPPGWAHPSREMHGITAWPKARWGNS